MANKIKWEDANFKWDKAPTTGIPYTWNDVQLIIRAAGEDITQWEDFNKKKLIKLILKVHGNTITESKQKEIKQYKIKASDIKITAEKVLVIELVTENIKF